ncbi:hypothetical protein A3758_31760, partial [Oleiphilus sp. HI0118]
VIELALVLDGSGSIGQSDFDLQTQAYQNIFSSGTFYDDFVVGADQLYVSSWQFSATTQKEQDWFLINDNASAAAFGATFADIDYMQGWTNTADAISMVAGDILSNNIDGDELVMDISTDGVPCVSGSCPQNYAISVGEATSAASNGIVVNAIGVGSGIDVNYLDAITQPSNGFYTTATDFSAFETALAGKLFREINDPPTSVSEPATLSLFGLGLA